MSPLSRRKTINANPKVINNYESSGSLNKNSPKVVRDNRNYIFKEEINQIVPVNSPKRRKIKSSRRTDGENSIILQKSSSPKKKFMVRIDNKTVHFGAKNYSDYTIHKDKKRMHRYENRHRSRENWKKSGIKKAGFWSKWILWNKPSFLKSIKDAERRFKIKIKRKI